jgi:hypothetical protein
VLGALVFTAGRAASFLALEDQLEALRSWTGELDRTLPGCGQAHLELRTPEPPNR